MSVLEQYEPKEVLQYFEALCEIPRGTFDTKRVSDYCVRFATERGLAYTQDEANNVIIKKPGTPGYEDSEPVIIQGHLDMVCEKTEESTHDFSKDPIEVYVEDGFVKAKDTTLGGDDGIAIAYALAILDSKDIPHPPIEAVFTTDEETGMGGANAIDLSGLEGKMLINIDSDVEGTLLAGCAGGFRKTITFTEDRKTKKGSLVSIHIGGLKGGHSGIEIDQQRGNANKMMGRLLNRLSLAMDVRIKEVNGGAKDNVIPSNCNAVILVDKDDATKAQRIVEEMKTIWDVEFGADEPELNVSTSVQENQEAEVFTKKHSRKLIFFMDSVQNGVQEFSRELAGLVETSLNLGVVKTEGHSVTAWLMIRSSVESKKSELREALQTWADVLGGEAEDSGDYPAWMYKPDSRLRPIMAGTYEDMFGEEPILTTVHAGLECGLFSGKKPDLDCVSFGPAMYDIHSVNERLDIESTRRMWDYLKEVLKRCK